MFKAAPKPRRSLNKKLDKENNAECLNGLPKERFNMSIPNLNVGHALPVLDEKLTRRLTRKDKPEDDVTPKMLPKLPTCEQKKATIDEPLFNSLENINLIKDYSGDFMRNALKQSTSPNEFLLRHEINGQLRAKMVDWMIEVFSSYKCLEGTFFRAVQILDGYFQHVSQPLLTKQLHLAGVTAIFIAAKLDEIYPLKLKTVYEKIGHKKLPQELIRQKESQVLETLNFSIVKGTIYDMLCITLHSINQCKYVKDVELRLNSKAFAQLQQLSLYILKAVTFDYPIVSAFENQAIVAASCLIAFKMFEQLHSDFISQENIKSVYRLLQVSKQSCINCSNQILKLVKGFEKLYPGLGNLKKFSKMNLQGERFMSGSSQHARLPL